jgi:GR25 family glycosyltransferase involved in LPS biosynthesis
MEHNLVEAVYYINMDKSVERRQLMKKVLKDEVFDSMEKHRITGVDGTRKDILPYLYSQLQNIKIAKQYTTKTYSCLLSHLHALLEFSKSKYEIALIVEDDLSLDYKKYWQEDLNTCIRNAPSDWEILQLYYFCKVPKQLYIPWNNHYSTVAYIVNKKGVQSFLNQHYSTKFILNTNTKHESDVYIYKHMKTYVYKYPFFTTNLNNSFIHPSHVKNIHAPCKQKVENMLKKRSKKIKKRNNITKRYHKS